MTVYDTTVTGDLPVTLTCGDSSWSGTMAGSADVPYRGSFTVDRLALPKSDSPIDISGSVMLETAGTNTVRISTDVKSAVRVPEGSKLELTGNGTLNAVSTGNGGSGIGSSYREHSGEIVIQSGTVNADAYVWAAGIGGGDGGGTGNVTVNGGIVTATGGSGGAGIGGGYKGTGNVTVTGGIVTATGGSDGEKIAIDAEVKVLYQENEKNIIGQYIIFCKAYNEQRKKDGQTKKAVTETIRICKDRNVLKEYLESKKSKKSSLKG